MSKKSTADNKQENRETEEVETELVVENPEVSPEGGDSPEAELEQARQEARENHERYLRALADLENYRRRAVREKEEVRRYALSSFLEEFTSILDNLYLGMDAASKHPETKGMVDGFSMVLQQMTGLLNQHGLEEVIPDGEEFDPNLHDCLSQQPSEEYSEGTILQVIRRGYKLNGRLLRPAAVVVSSGPAKESEETGS